MLVESTSVHGFQLLTIREDLTINSDVTHLRMLVREYLEKGAVRIAFSFTKDSYLYTRSIAVLVQCLEMIMERNGTLAIVGPNEDILDLIRAINLESRIVIVSAQDELHRYS